MLEEKTITLKTPLQLKDHPGSEAVSEITLKEPTAFQLMKNEKFEGYEGMMRTIAEVSGVAYPLVQQMGMTDLAECMKFINSLYFPADNAATGSETA